MTTTDRQDQRPHEYSFFAALLSYLVPGMGQIYQGRIGKGLLFFFSLYGMFFYGWWLGDKSNVYLPHGDSIVVLGKRIDEPWASIGHRPQFAGQFWMGVCVWPAIVQYRFPEKAGFLRGYQRAPSEEELNRLQKNGDKLWDLAWVYTVVAGVLNILVIYDAFAGPVFQLEPQKPEWAPV
ncbi:MAG: hypothetical protein KatS3mg105_2841 [Gemmatales bacterium]|nr:MAG: hypothetical protein KatS3mg105_2841 [Gemmatales bacterium]